MLTLPKKENRPFSNLMSAICSVFLTRPGLDVPAASLELQLSHSSAIHTPSSGSGREGPDACTPETFVSLE